MSRPSRSGCGLPTPLGLAARIIQTVAQAIVNDTDTRVLFNALDFDAGGFFNAAQPGLLTIPVDGIYSVSSYLQYAPNVFGFRRIEIKRSTGGGPFVSIALDNRMAVTSAGWTTEIGTTTDEHLLAGDVLEVITHQFSGGNLNVNASINAFACAGAAPPP